MEESSMDDFGLEHAVEDEWEFDAPQFYDFTATEHDDQDVDLWFDAKLHDDVSPEIDWDEYEVEHDFDAGPSSPASVYSSHSAAATPITPTWRSRVEERSPQREDNTIGQAMQTATDSEASSTPYQSPSPLKSPYRVAEAPHTPTQLTTCTIPPLSTPRMTPQRTNASISISTSIPGKAAMSIAISSSTNEQPHKTMVATAVVTHPPAQPARKVGLSVSSLSANNVSRLNLAAPKQPVSTKTYVHNLTLKAEPKKTGLTMPKAPPSKLGLPKTGQARTAPLQPTSQNRLNQATASSSLASKATQSVRRTVLAKKTSPARPIKHQPFASQRSVVPPIRTNGASKTVQPTQPMVARPARVPLSERATVASAMRAKASAASHASTVPTKSVAAVKRMPTVAVTPEFMKRRAARLRDEPRLTTEQLRAMEAERQRRAFLQELARKNANRGFAPRVVYHHGETATAGGAQNRWRR